MTTKHSLVFGLLAIILAGIAYAVLTKTEEKGGEITKEKQQALIEIREGTVSLDDEPLQSGDAVSPPAVLMSSGSTTAEIHFPDGSIATMASNTTLTLSEADFPTESKTVVSKLFLATGKVFLSITELVTPESTWEVKTGNAVAVVRGTAFSVSYENGSSTVEVTEDTVSVATLDPETGEVIPGTEVLVTEGSKAEVTDEDAQNGAGPRVSNIESTEEEEKPNEDTVNDEQVQNIREIQANTVTKRPTRLAIEGTIPATVTEGDTLQFSARLTYDDGSVLDVTNDVSWDVAGDIGVVRTPGVFIADIPDSVAELGSAPGSVIATWSSESGDVSLLGQTTIFEVHAFVPPTPDNLRG